MNTSSVWRIAATAMAALLGLGGAVALAPPASAAEFSDYVAISATELDFGDDLRFGDPNVTMSYTLTALQDITLSTSGWYTPRPDDWLGEVSGGDCPGLSVFNGTVQLSAGQVCTMTVTLNPNVSIAPGNGIWGGRGWNVTGPSGPATTNQYVTYKAVVYALSWDPRALSFTAAPGETSEPQTVTFTNLARVPLSALETGGHDTSFTLDLGSCGSPIAVGDTCTLSYTYTGDESSPSAVSNTWVHFSATGPTGLKAYTYDSTVLYLSGWTQSPPRVADVAVTKAVVGPGPIVAGDLIAWDVVVTNLGPDAVGTVWLYDFPGLNLDLERVEGAQCQSAVAGIPAPDGIELRDSYAQCVVGPLDAGASATVRVWTRVDLSTPPGTVLTNSASAYGDSQDPTYDNNYTNAETPPTAAVADVQIIKSAPPGAVRVGDGTVWHVSVTNAGPDDAADVTVSDTLPPGTRYVSGPEGCVGDDAEVVCSLGTLTVDEVWDGDIVLLVADPARAGSTVSNTAVVTTTALDPDLSNNSSTAVSSEVDPPAPVVGNLAVGIDAPARAVAGGLLDPVVTVTNTGDTPMVNTALVTNVPAGTSYLGAGGARTAGRAAVLPAACQASGQVVTCTLGTVEAGEDVAVPVHLQVDAGAAGTVLVLDAAVTSATPDGDPADDTATAQVTVTAEPNPEPTPTEPEPEPTTTPSPPPGDPTAQPSAGTAGSGTSPHLARTGSSTPTMIWFSAMLLVLGTAGLILRRDRTS